MQEILRTGLLTAVAIFAGCSALFSVPNDFLLGTINARALQHALCFLGLGMLLPAISGGLGSRHSRAAFYIIGGVMVTIAWIALLSKFSVSKGTQLVLVLLANGVVYLPFYAFLTWAFRDVRWSAMRWSWVGVGLCFGMSLLWEALIQPLFDVYGGAPRGYVQLDQLIADGIGLTLGYLAYLTWMRPSTLPNQPNNKVAVAC